MDLDPYANLSVPASAPLLAGQTCALHPGTPAVGTCKRCGDYMCGPCRAPGEDAELCARCAELAGGGRYHAVPPWRFYLFGVCTFGLYNVYWAYRCWAGIKARDRSDIWASLRGIFIVFTAVSLTEDLNRTRVARGLPEVHMAWPAAFTLISLLGRFLDRTDAIPAGVVVGFLFLQSGVLLPIVRGMREVTSRTELAERDALRTRHVIGLALAGIMGVLIVIGAVLPDEELNGDPGAEVFDD
jgi:hypothetical protein